MRIMKTVLALSAASLLAGASIVLAQTPDPHHPPESVTPAQPGAPGPVQPTPPAAGSPGEMMMNCPMMQGQMKHGQMPQGAMMMNCPMMQGQGQGQMPPGRPPQSGQ